MGAAASDPSPKNKVESSVLVSCAASRIVNGRTRTATVIEEALSSVAMLAKEAEWKCGSLYGEQLMSAKGAASCLFDGGEVLLVSEQSV